MPLVGSPSRPEGAGGDAAFELLQKGDGATKRHGWSFRVIDEAGIVTTSKELITCTPGVRSGKPCISRRLQTSSSAALPKYIRQRIWLGWTLMTQAKS